jgi:hypothetical protein
MNCVFGNTDDFVGIEIVSVFTKRSYRNEEIIGNPIISTHEICLWHRDYGMIELFKIGVVFLPEAAVDFS